MKKILIVAGALIIFGGSAGAGYYFMSRPAEANVDAPKEDAYVDPVKDPRFIEIDPLVLPVVEDGQILYHMFIKLSLEVDGKGAAQTILNRKLRLHNAFYLALYDGPIQSDDGDELDPEKIKSVVRRRARAVLGEDVLQAVHIQQAVPGQK